MGVIHIKKGKSDPILEVVEEVRAVNFWRRAFTTEVISLVQNP